MINPEIFEEVSMQIILFAGDARNFAQNALDAAMREDYAQAEKYLIEAQENITAAHLAQTDMIQKSLSEDKLELPNLLFIHAQDTLMTIMSELNFAHSMVKMHKQLTNKINEERK